MMRELGQYVVSLTAAALVSGMVLTLIREGPVRTLARLVCGVFLTITAISPLTRMEFSDLTAVEEDYLAEGRSAAALGENLALDSRSQLIKEGLEAYILDKATALDAEISAEVRLDGEGNPVSVIISGEVSSHIRRRLETVLTEELGISKENQQWTG